jgi:hypothetical protein
MFLISRLGEFASLAHRAGARVGKTMSLLGSPRYSARRHPHPRASVPVYDLDLITSRLGRSMSDDIQAELERLRAENEALKKGGRGKLSMKVSEKGALSVYGMGRFPVTLYKEQWLRLLGMADDIKAFIEANNERLKTKE